jgi:hypothetical protein
MKGNNKMKKKINQIIDHISEFLAYRKGLLPFVGLLFIFFNWVLQVIPGNGWLGETNTLLHLGLIVAILGFMAAWAL